MAEIEHDEWCDANGCRCGNCPCLGPPLCKPAKVEPPEGWFPMGHHIDIPGPLEFSTEKGEDGLPLWERPKSGDRECPHGYTEGDHHWYGCMGVDPFEQTPDTRW